MTRTVDCGPGHVDGRRRKMEAFVAAAQALVLFAKVDPTLANHLRRLLQMKPKAQYSAFAVSNQELKTSERASQALVAAARDA